MLSYMRMFLCVCVHMHVCMFCAYFCECVCVVCACDFLLPLTSGDIRLPSPSRAETLVMVYYIMCSCIGYKCACVLMRVWVLMSLRNCVSMQVVQCHECERAIWCVRVCVISNFAVYVCGLGCRACARHRCVFCTSMRVLIVRVHGRICKVCLYVCVYVCVCVCVCACVCMCMCACVCVRLCICTRMCVHAPTCECVYVFVHDVVRALVCVCIWCVYVYLLPWVYLRARVCAWFHMHQRGRGS